MYISEEAETLANGISLKLLTKSAKNLVIEYIATSIYVWLESVVQTLGSGEESQEIASIANLSIKG